jgi:hypothetical protein
MKFNDNELIEQIRAIGQGLIDNASSIVTNLENKSNIYINISFTPDSAPSIDVQTEFFPDALLNYFKNNY